MTCFRPCRRVAKAVPLAKAEQQGSAVRQALRREAMEQGLVVRTPVTGGPRASAQRIRC